MKAGSDLCDDIRAILPCIEQRNNNFALISGPEVWIPGDGVGIIFDPFCSVLWKTKGSHSPVKGVIRRNTGRRSSDVGVRAEGRITETSGKWAERRSCRNDCR